MKLTKLNVISFLSAIGAGIALYLTYAHYAITNGSTAPCILGSSCDAIWASKYATLFGIPVAILGLIGFSLIFVLSWAKKARWIFYLALLGLVFLVYLAYIELIIFRSLCPLCTITHLIGLSILGLSYKKKYLKFK